MAKLTAYSLVQPALAVEDLETAIDRVHDLLGAVPSERLRREGDITNAVYAFENETHLELLSPENEGHTRWRFVRKFGSGLYMFCVDMQSEDPGEVEEALKRQGKRIVAGGRRDAGNVVAGYHVHPRDACNLLTLLAVKADPRDNGAWAGHGYRAYVSGNARYAQELRGVLARTTNPAAEAPCFGTLGLEMAALGQTGAWKWQGPTGTIVELWPAESWPGGPVDSRRDYVLCFRARHPEALAERLTKCGLTGAQGLAGGRWLSSVDPVLGVRFAIEANPA